jgi:hypothetical protein
MSSPTNEIKASAKLPSMPFLYLVTLLILLPFVLFRKHSGLVRHIRCGARRNALGDGLFGIGNRIYGVLESQNFSCEGGTPLALPPLGPSALGSGCILNGSAFS